MANVYTGEKRSLTFAITKTRGGAVLQGYPKTYDGRLAFPGYSAISDSAAQKLTTSEYNTRYSAFVSYVQALEPGWDPNTDMTNNPTFTDTVACPPPPTTTTTSAVAVTTTTTTVPVTTTTTTV